MNIKAVHDCEVFESKNALFNGHYYTNALWNIWK